MFPKWTHQGRRALRTQLPPAPLHRRSSCRKPDLSLDSNYNQGHADDSVGDSKALCPGVAIPAASAPATRGSEPPHQETTANPLKAQIHCFKGHGFTQFVRLPKLRWAPGSPANAMQTLSSRAQIFRTVLSSCSLATDFFSTPRTTMSFPRTPTFKKNQHSTKKVT